ncbi:MAG: hypothetical protein ABIG84_08400 [archaeon]
MKTVNDVVILTERLKNLDAYLDEKITFYKSLGLIPITSGSYAIVEKGIDKDLGEVQKLYNNIRDESGPYNDFIQIQKWEKIINNKWRYLEELREEILES